MQYPLDNMNTMFQPKVYMEYPHKDTAYILEFFEVCVISCIHSQFFNLAKPQLNWWSQRSLSCHWQGKELDLEHGWTLLKPETPLLKGKVSYDGQSKVTPTNAQIQMDGESIDFTFSPMC